jgi:glutathione synthase/RimK-type ligase-like ATP-grasp enzyme
MAELHGIPVIDDAHSIRVCCDKVNMYSRLVRAGVPIPATVFLKRDDITGETAERLFAEYGGRLILKAPNSSFSSHVEKVTTPDAFVQVGKRFLSRADLVVAQEFVQSDFDWRVGVLAGRPLYACRYLFPDKTFKIQAMVDGHMRFAKVEGVPLEEAPPNVIETALAAARATGKGLYGVDLKERDEGDTVVIEVNDNPTINAGEEDQHAPDIYDRIVEHLLEGTARVEEAT